MDDLKGGEKLPMNFGSSFLQEGEEPAGTKIEAWWNFCRRNKKPNDNRLANGEYRQKTRKAPKL